MIDIIKVADEADLIVNEEAKWVKAKDVTVADKADLIVNGYAFTKSEEGYRVLNLNNPEHALGVRI